MMNTLDSFAAFSEIDYTRYRGYYGSFADMASIAAARAAAEAKKALAKQKADQVKSVETQYKAQVGSINSWYNEARRGMRDKAALKSLSDQKTYYLQDAKNWRAEALTAINRAFAGVSGMPTPSSISLLSTVLSVQQQTTTANSIINLPDGRTLSVNPAYGSVVLVTLSTGQQAYVQDGNPTVPLAYPPSSSMVPSGSFVNPPASGGAGPAPIDPGQLYYQQPQQAWGDGSPQTQPGYYPQSPQRQYPVYETPVTSLWPGDDFFNPPQEVVMDVPEDIYTPSDASLVQDANPNITMVSPEILDALMQSQGSMYYADPWAGGFASYGNQLPVRLARRGPVRGKVKRLTAIESLNSLPILQDFSAFEWVGPVIQAAGQVGAAALSAELSRPGQTSKPAAPVVIQQPAAVPQSSGMSGSVGHLDNTAMWAIGGGVALLGVILLMKRKK